MILLHAKFHEQGTDVKLETLYKANENKKFVRTWKLREN